MSDMYLIWCTEQQRWWGPDKRGFTIDLNAAGRYTRDSAINIAMSGNSAFGQPIELPVREADLLAAIPAMPTTQREDSE